MGVERGDGVREETALKKQKKNKKTDKKRRRKSGGGLLNPQISLSGVHIKGDLAAACCQHAAAKAGGGGIWPLPPRGGVWGGL